jgi:hypothetical protein
MLVLDTETKTQHQAQVKKDAYAVAVNEWCAVELDSARYVSFHPDDPLRQWGQAKSPRELIALIQKLNPNLVIEVNWLKPSKCAIYWLHGSVKEYLFAFENSVMPEYSIMQVKETLVPLGGDFLDHRDINIKPLPRERQRAFDALLSDIERHPIVPTQDASCYNDPRLDTLDEIMEDDPTEGWKIERTVGREETRGWRTVLVCLVQRGLASPAKVERLAGVGQRASWQAHMGKGDVFSPW